MTAAAPAKGPLDGIRVIDLTANVLGPMATQILGDMGADVIKVEEPSGDHTRHVGPRRSPAMGVFFLNFNRNKRSIVLNLKTEQDRAVLYRLIETADVFVHSMRPDAAVRLGIDYASVKALRPDILYASASGYRADSSRRNDPAFDDVIQGMSGLAAMNRTQDGAPRYLPTVIADKFCGHALASSVGMALFHRERSGQGQEIQLPMFDTLVAFNLGEHLWAGALGRPDLGLGYDRMFTPHRRPYPTKDGYICLLANTDAQWQRMFAAMDRPDLAADPRFITVTERTQHIDLLYGIVAEAMTQKTTAQWHDLLDRAEIPNGPVNDLQGILDDPYLHETGFFEQHEHPTEGRLTTMRVPVTFSQSPASVRRLAPILGGHTLEIITELGLSEADLSAPPPKAMEPHQ